MNVARVIVDPPQSGDWNMAVDEALLHSAVSGMTTLRFYQWSEPTLSLGYFQSLSDRHSHAASRDCAVVRRASGGGAILHDRELTYSFAMPIGDRLSAEAAALYAAFHDTLIETLQVWGVAARLCRGVTAGQRTRAPQPFLCFQRLTAGDVLLDEDKICGSAQRRQGQAVLQHGSVLLGASPKAPEIPGIEELSGRSIDPVELGQRWLLRLASRLRLSWQAGDLSPEERRHSESVRQARFAAAAWLQRRP